MNTIIKTALFLVVAVAVCLALFYQPLETAVSAQLESCASCSGTGKEPCTRCRGSGRVMVKEPCVQCNGTGKSSWELTKGTKVESTLIPPNCQACSASAQKTVERNCDKCHKLGTARCRVCQGIGETVSGHDEAIAFGLSGLERIMRLAGQEPDPNPAPFVVPLIGKSTLAERYCSLKSVNGLTIAIEEIGSPTKTAEDWILPVRVLLSKEDKTHSASIHLYIRERKITRTVKDPFGG